MSEILRVCDNYVLDFASVIVGQFPNYWNNRRTTRILLIQDVFATAKEKEQKSASKVFPRL